MGSNIVCTVRSMGNIKFYIMEEKKMIKAFNDIMILGNGGKILVIAYLLTSIITGWICISYFTWRAHEEKKENDQYKRILEELEDED